MGQCNVFSPFCRKIKIKNILPLLGMMVHDFNLSTWEIEVGGSL